MKPKTTCKTLQSYVDHIGVLIQLGSHLKNVHLAKTLASGVVELIVDLLKAKFSSVKKNVSDNFSPPTTPI